MEVQIAELTAAVASAGQKTEAVEHELELLKEVFKLKR